MQISNFDDIFKVWVEIEGGLNLDDNGYPAIYGVNAGSSPENAKAVEMMQNILKSKTIVLSTAERQQWAQDVAKAHLKKYYWDTIKEPNPTRKLLIFFYKKAWNCSYTRSLDLISLAIQIWFSVDETAMQCSAWSKNSISYVAVRRRIIVFNKHFGAQIPL